MVRKIVSICLVGLLCSVANAEVKLNSLFTDGAVLQRNVNIPVWGTARDGEKISVSFNGQKASTTARNGKWDVHLRPMKAGGPFTMTVKGDNTIEVKNVLVGEVWICSGQSNMAWTLARSKNGDKAVAESADPQLRLFSVPPIPQDQPVSDVNSAWHVCGPDTVPNFSAVGYYFGRDLRKVLGVPVGLINSSYGGTISQAWTSKRTFDAYPEYRDFVKNPPQWAAGPNKPCVLYNGMIAPLIPYAVKGAIWYQGESNAGGAYEYRTLLAMLIQNWREDWGQKEFPFLIVQLAPYMAINSEPEESAWAELRESQLITCENVPQTALTVITDYGDPNDIHPKIKEPVGARLALAARAIAYGENIVYSGPVYESMEIRDSRAILSFNSVGGGLVAKDGELTGFTIAGADGKFCNAHASIQGDKIVVSSPNVDKPVAVRYGWANCPVVNLFNAEGLPASPFRTDNFKTLTSPK